MGHFFNIASTGNFCHFLLKGEVHLVTTLCYLNGWKLFLMSKFIQYKLFVSISFIDVWKMNIDNLESTTSQVMFCGDWTSWEAWIASVLCNYSLRFIKKNLLSFTRLVHPTQLKPITFLPHNIQKRKWNVKVASKKNCQFSLNARPIWSILTIVFNPFAHGIFVKGTFSFKASGQVHFFWRNVSYKKRDNRQILLFYHCFIQDKNIDVYII